MDSVSKAILNTLAYADVFDAALTKNQLFAKLISPRKIDFKDFKSNLSSLIKSNQVYSSKDLYSLKKSNIETQISKIKYSKEKIKYLKKKIDLFKDTPFIEAVLITGSLACNNCKKDDDIDLLLITKPNRLWLVRFLILVKARKLRRYPKSKNVSNKFCFNIFLESNNLKFLNHNLYVANEVIQSFPLIDKNNVYSNFLKSNSWIEKYLSNAINPKDSNNFHPNLQIKTTLLKKSKTENDNSFWFFNLLNYVFFIFQYIYMLPKITNETISLHKALFHPNRIDKNIIYSYRTRIKA